jgi:hypothetical protein
MESSARLSQLALNIDPAVQRSRRWRFLACKRAIGLRAWQRVSPAVDWLRSISPSEDR